MRGRTCSCTITGLFWGMSEKVAGFQPHPDGLIRLQGVSVSK